MTTFDLAAPGLTVTEVHHNLSPSKLYEHAIRFEKDASIAENGALVAYSGAKTGRSPITTLPSDTRWCWPRVRRNTDPPQPPV